MIKKILQKSSDDWQRIAYSLWKDLKFSLRPVTTKSVVYIVGCQRSGSTMLYRIFTKDHRTKVYHEFGNLNTVGRESGIRIKPLPALKAHLQRIPHSLVVAKPLVESQHIEKLLDSHSSAKCIWLYRNYLDVAASNLKKFGPMNGKKNLRAVINKASGNWRSEAITDEMYSVLDSIEVDLISDLDAAALFWWVRNYHFFNQGLCNNPDIYTCRYENLVSNPRKELRKLYDFIQIQTPGDKVVAHVHQRSLGKGETKQLSPQIEALCEKLLNRLEACTN